MFSKKFFNKQQSISAALVVFASVVAVAGFVYGATTIGTNISVDGTLTVLGASTLTGNVGIGTTSPAGLLSVSGLSGLMVTNTGSAYTAYFEDVANDSSPVVIDASGNVGIGTTSPTAPLHIDGGGALLRLDGPAGNHNVMNFARSGSDKGIIGIAANANSLIVGSVADDLVIRSNVNKILFSAQSPTAHMVIATSGNVGIGTSTPYSRFHVTQGASATTTVNFGEVGVASSKACFNIKNVSGADISFYFNAANTIVVESNLCR